MLLVEQLLFLLGIFALSAFAGYLYIPQIVLIAKKRKLFDEIDSRKSHIGLVPRIGGISFFPIFLFSISIFCSLRYAFNYPIQGVSEVQALIDLLSLISGLTLLYLVGLADDLSGVKYKIKFCIQIFASLAIVISGFWINNFQGLFGIYNIPWFIGVPVTILVAVFVINAYNLIDGIDGLCSGLSILALSTLAVWFCVNGLLLYAMMSCAMLGILCVFFFFNTKGSENKVFMGDTGSLALGFVIVFLGLKFYWLSANSDIISGIDIFSFNNPLAAILGITFVPLFDTVRVFSVRIYRGYPPFHPDKRHIHHKFLKLGFKHTKCTFCIIAIQCFFIVMNTILQPLNVNLIVAIDILVAIAGTMLLNYIINLKSKINK